MANLPVETNGDKCFKIAPKLQTSEYLIISDCGCVYYTNNKYEYTEMLEKNEECKEHIDNTSHL